MPWHETDPVNERLKFVAAHQSGRQTLTELCRKFRISRKTGYKILKRYREEGPEGLRDRLRAPLSHPNQTAPEVEGAILRVRKAHPTWGSKKIQAVLAREDPEGPWPVRSTMDAVLKRAGVVSPRRKRRRRPPSSPPVVEATEPNDVWSIDYKGWFRVGDGTRCDPLTVNDVCSRVSLECRALVSPKLPDVKRRLEAAFIVVRLAEAHPQRQRPTVRFDGSRAACRGLECGCCASGSNRCSSSQVVPDQNGRHERFHETLKAETANPPCATIPAQQGIVHAVPANLQRGPTARGSWDARSGRAVGVLVSRDARHRSLSIIYPDEFETRRVRSDGSMKWAGGYVFVGEAMAGEMVAATAVDDDLWHVFLGPMRLGSLHERSRTIVPIGAERDPGGVTHVPGHDDA